MTWSCRIVMKGIMEHCDDRGMKHCDDKGLEHCDDRVMEHCDDRDHGAL